MIQKRHIGWISIVVISLSPIIPWLLAMTPVSLRFMNINSTMTSIGELLALVGVTMFCLSIVLSTRLKLFEDYFGGMNQVYIAHHIYGGIAFVLLLFHPLALATALLPYSIKSAALYLLPGADWSINFGIATLLLMMSLLILTFFITLPYRMWLFTHKFLGVAFFLASIHGLNVSSDISRSIVMKYYMGFFFSLGLFAYLCRTVFGKYLIKRYRYTVTQVKTIQDNTVEITVTPEQKTLAFSPGQFVFLSFRSKGVTREIHPFSITATNDQHQLIFAIKAEGDYTATLKNLQSGDTALLEGSFGRFSYQRVNNKKQIWIAGGIGITPFISMAKSIINLAYQIDLYYTVRSEQEAVYVTDLQNIARENSNVRFFPWFTSTQGRLTAASIAKTSGDLAHKEFFICGPPPMMKSLRKQLRELSISNNLIHTEEFSIQ